MKVVSKTGKIKLFDSISETHFESQNCLNTAALGIAVEILFVRYEQKDCTEKPDPAT